MLVAVCVCQMAAAQRMVTSPYNPSRDRFGNNTVTFQAMPAIFGGYGIEYSRNVFDQQHWVKFGAVLYVSSSFSKTHLEDCEKMLGFSVGAHHQYNYFELPDVGFRMFFQWGVDYTYLDLRNVAKAETHIEKVGLDAAIGFRQNIAKPLYFEFYIGYGQKWLAKVDIDNRNVSSQITDSKVTEPRYDRHMFDYGRGGSSLVLGLNIGFLF